MESLAIFVGFLLLFMFVTTLGAFILSFIKKKWATILATIFSTIAAGFSVLFIFGADGSRNMIIIGATILVIIIVSGVNIVKNWGHKNAVEI